MVTNPSPTPLALTLARGSRDTLPVQLARQIRDHVSHGLLDPGQRLPSSRSLAADLGVAR
ncbi:MAG: GntR family transcriptional regulator, partial [Nocardioidaceae bacterium]